MVEPASILPWHFLDPAVTRFPRMKADTPSMVVNGGLRREPGLSSAVATVAGKVIAVGIASRDG
jgi:hypothetical protein